MLLCVKEFKLSVWKRVHRGQYRNSGYIRKLQLLCFNYLSANELLIDVNVDGRSHINAAFPYFLDYNFIVAIGV